MATIDYTAMPTDVITTSPIDRDPPPQHGPRMHRIRTVRLQQGASLRSVARNSGVDVRQLRLQEQESTDVRLSDLHKWQQALEVPLAELLVEPDASLSQPVMDRARMVRADEDRRGDPGAVGVDWHSSHGPDAVRTADRHHAGIGRRQCVARLRPAAKHGRNGSHRRASHLG